MKLKLVIDKKDEANRMLVICAIGLLSSLESKLMTIEDSQQYLFNSDTISILEKEGIDEQVIELIKLAQKLDTDQLPTSVVDLKSKAKKCLKELEYTPDFNENIKWLHRF